jgi:hypothetical protein
MRATLATAVLLLAGCTVTPQDVPLPTLPSADGSFQDSGLLRMEIDVHGNVLGYDVTQFWLDTYQYRVAVYGKQLVPPITPTAATASPVNGITTRPNDLVRGAVYFVTVQVQETDAKLSDIQHHRITVPAP